MNLELTKHHALCQQKMENHVLKHTLFFTLSLTALDFISNNILIIKYTHKCFQWCICYYLNYVLRTDVN